MDGSSLGSDIGEVHGGVEVLLEEVVPITGKTHEQISLTYKRGRESETGESKSKWRKAYRQC